MPNWANIPSSKRKTRWHLLHSDTKQWGDLGNALITSTKISGMQYQSSYPVLEDTEFMMYAVTHN